MIISWLHQKYRNFVHPWYVAGCADLISTKDRILDIGCGQGLFAEYLSKKFGAEVIGVDLIRPPRIKVPFFCCDARSLPFPDGSFDQAVLVWVLHHVQQPQTILKEAARVTRKYIFVYEDLTDGLVSRLATSVHGLAWQNLFGKRTDGLSFLKEQEWLKLFEELDLEVVQSISLPLLINPIYPAKRKLFVLRPE